MNTTAQEKIELSREDRVLLVNVSNEVLNGFHIENSELTIGVDKSKYQEVFQRLSKPQAQMGSDDVKLMMNALAATLKELGPDEFETRTAFDYEYGQVLLERMQLATDRSAVRKSLGHFSLWGDFELDQITTLLGLEPSAVYPKGEMLDGFDTPAKIATWDLHCPPELGPNAQVAFLLDKLWPRSKAVSELCMRYTGEVNLASAPGDVLRIDAEALHQLAGLSVALNSFYNEDETGDAD